MTPGFGVLYYTDCAPGQGLQGGAGFQFQAASGPPATEAMALVQRTALYEPPPSWMRERRPVADYPRSLAHTAQDGLLVTAAGRYLGQEANGSREGNQFTHAVATRDPTDYGLVRPAQLWAAPWWASAPASGTELAPVPAQPGPGPLDTETVRDRVRATPGGEPLLTALLSAVHRLRDPERRRTVLLVTADPERAACWIAAATLLLPQPAALRASFKIFVADARYGQHDIIALHPDWAGSWVDTGPGSGLVVFDLDGGRLGGADPVEPTAAARFWVPRFLGGDAHPGYDAYDVVDAVELAGQFARARGGAGGEDDEPTAADRIAAAVVAAGERLTDREQPLLLADWLLAAPEPVLHIARDALLDAVLAADLGAAELRVLAAAVAGRGWVAAAAAVRAAQLSAELAETLAAPDGVAALRVLLDSTERTDPAGPAPTGPAPPSPAPTSPAVAEPVDDAAAGEHGVARRAELESALRAARPDQVPALLTLADRHGVHPRAQEYRDAAHAFVRWWLDDTAADTEYGRWPAPPETLDRVRDELQDRLAGPQAAAAVLAIRRTWWRPLHRLARDPRDPLDRQVIAAAAERLDPAERTGLIGDVLYHAFAARPPDEHPSTLASRVLFGGRAGSATEVRSFLVALREHGSELSEEAAFELGVVLAREPEPSAEGLWCARELQRLGLLLVPAVAELAAQDQRVSLLLDELRAAEPARSPAEAAALLAGVPDPVLAIRAGELVDAVLGASRPLAVEVLRRAARPPYLLVQALEQRWPRPAAVPDQYAGRALAMTFLLARGPTFDEAQAAAHRLLELRLEDRVRNMSEPARAAVDTSYQPPLGKPWQDWVNGITSTRRKLLRRFDTRPGDPGRRGS